jgi:hypothetical protein
VDLESFTYQAAKGKIKKIEIMLMDLLQATEQGELVAAKHLAAVLGSVITLRTSHGTMVQHMSKDTQHRLGWMVLHFRWDCQLRKFGQNWSGCTPIWPVSTDKGSEMREDER